MDTLNSSATVDKVVDFHKLPGIPFAFPFEANFDAEFHAQWIRDNSFISIIFCIPYLAFLFFGTKYMNNRQPFDLRVPLGIWSFLLAIYSAYTSMRLMPHWIHMMTTSNGMAHSFCRNDYKEDPRATFVIAVFIWSKAIELGDTVFIVLRKQKLIFLHWFHHVLTLSYSFYTFPEWSGGVMWFSAMNALIHTVMYSYYGIRALRLFRVPKIVNIIITLSQILQMIIGFIISATIAITLMNGQNCSMSTFSSVGGLVVYGSFLILFVNFFIQSYFPSKSPKLIEANGSKNNNEIKKKL